MLADERNKVQVRALRLLLAPSRGERVSQTLTESNHFTRPLICFFVTNGRRYWSIKANLWMEMFLNLDPIK